ncbi:UNVERIFIED_CONTAM: hypothetical protein Scaly_1173300 [Sesamum calycinum]|uniref:Reverse transcriptase/retrotransposon-derived protein RNase H-like domain-containing protein n=1 Tax=Sesamum calycinum TaxID=2727403 RepID=A0AAW2Q347_9LAMI
MSKTLNRQNNVNKHLKNLAKLPLLVKPIPSDTLYLNLSSTTHAISSVLVREEDGAQTPIYYVSKILNGAKCRYPPIERMALALVTTGRKLRLYFLSYPIGVKTNTPLKHVLGKPEEQPRKRFPKRDPGCSTWMDPPPYNGAEQA